MDGAQAQKKMTYRTESGKMVRIKHSCGMKEPDKLSGIL